jgi:phage replication initiation protein
MTLTYQGFAPQPPDCNTGVSLTTPPQTPGIGWLRFTSKHKALVFDLMNYWSLISGDKWELTNRGLFGYEESYRSVYGASVNFSHDRPEFCADFRQSTLGAIPLSEVHSFAQYCDALLECKITRIDTYVDDYSQILSRENIIAASESHNYRSHARSLRENRDITRKADGWTITAGSRSSHSYLRIYDKAAESKTPQPCVRSELELKDSRGQAAFKAIVDSKVEDFLELFKGLISGMIEFVDREADSNISRCPLLEWWSKFMDNANKLRLPTPEKPKTIERVFHWMQRQWIGTIAMLREIYGIDSIQEFIAQLARDHDGHFSLAQRLIMEQELLPTMP